MINDLALYAAQKKSESSLMLVAEGILSSLTCPLVANGIPVGFLFFSSSERNTYADAHIEIFMAIANQLSVILEKSQMVSELAARQREIEARAADLERLNEIKNAFMGIVAHDLRSPLGVIQMTADLMMMPGSQFDGPSMLEMASDIRTQSDFMLQLVSDLLDFTQIEAGRLSVSPQRMDLTELIQTCVGHANQSAQTKQTQVSCEPLPPLSVLGDPVRLRQVMDNLLSNAVKFSPPGSSIIVDTHNDGDMLCVKVTDEGPGISSEDSHRLFQPFARLSNRPTGGEKSTGLGLAICRGIIEAHHGQIGVMRAKAHGGSIFWFTLPSERLSSGESEK